MSVRHVDGVEGISKSGGQYGWDKAWLWCALEQ